MTRRVLHHGVLLVFVWGLGMLPATAEEILVGNAPTNPIRAGCSISIFSERLGSAGFQPLSVQFDSTGQMFLRDRSLRVVIRPRTQYASRLDFEFAFEVTLPEGAKRHREELLVPQFYRWDRCSVDVIEDGRLWAKSPCFFNMPPSVQDWGQHVSMGVIVPRDAKERPEKWSDFPDLRSIVTVLGEGPIDEDVATDRLSHSAARNFAETLNYGFARFRILDEDELHRHWLAYSQLDVVLVPYPVLHRIESQQSEQFAAIKKWVSAGGQVWTYATPGKLDTNSWLARSIRATANDIEFQPDLKNHLASEQVNSVAPIQYRPWNGHYYAQYANSTQEQTRKQAYAKLEKNKHSMVKTTGRTPLLSGLRMMPYGLGKVVLIDQQDPFPGSFQFWRALQSDNLKWEERNCVDYTSGSESLWAWLIAAVGVPPIKLFALLNGLFVLVMGPVLYFVLRHKSRLYLLYFLAPALALVTTMGLFSYAFLSDGFENRARIRDLVWVDARHSTDQSAIVSQSRQTYYTVLDSENGLQFGEDRFVLPLQHQGVREDYQHHAPRERHSDYQITWNQSRLHFGGDFLPTRTQVHYLVTHPSQAPCPVHVTFDNQAVEITNRTEKQLRQIAVCDSKGGFWTVGEVLPGATVTLSKANSNIFQTLTDRLVEPDPADLPDSYRFTTALTERTLVEDRFERFINLPPQRSFVAIANVDDSDFALSDCQPEQCARVIAGLLP